MNYCNCTLQCREVSFEGEMQQTVFLCVLFSLGMLSSQLDGKTNKQMKNAKGERDERRNYKLYIKARNEGRGRRQEMTDEEAGKAKRYIGRQTNRCNIFCCNLLVYLVCWIRRRGWDLWWMARWKWWCSCQRCSGRAAWPQGCGAEACSSRWPDHLYPGHPSDGLRSAEWEERDRTYR